MAKEKEGVEYELLVAMDWDGSFTFEEGETQRFAVEAEAETLELNLDVPSAAAEGVYRMRVIYAPKAHLTGTCGSMRSAAVYDFAIDYVPVRKHTYDLEVKSLLIDYEGENPKAANFVVKNNGTKLREKATFAYRLSGEAWQSQEFDLNLDPTKEVTLTLPLDLSTLAAGTYTLTVRYETIDDRPENNEKSAGFTILKAGGSTPGEYYIQLAQYDRQDAFAQPDRINLGTLGGKDFNKDGIKSMTIEGWFRTDDLGTNSFARGKGITLGCTGEATASFPKNAILLVINNQRGEQLPIRTEENTFTPNQWRHVAMTLYFGNMVAYPENRVIYVDGKPLTTHVPSGARSVTPYQNTANSICLGDGLNGGIDLVRIWQVKLEEEKVKELAASPHALNLSTDGAATQGLVGEWLFTEGAGWNYTKNNVNQAIARLETPRDLETVGTVWCEAGDLISWAIAGDDAWKFGWKNRQPRSRAAKLPELRLAKMTTPRFPKI